MKIIDGLLLVFIQLVNPEFQDICYFIAFSIFIIYTMFIYSIDFKNGGIK